MPQARSSWLVASALVIAATLTAAVGAAPSGGNAPGRPAAASVTRARVAAASPASQLQAAALSQAGRGTPPSGTPQRPGADARRLTRAVAALGHQAGGIEAITVVIQQGRDRQFYLAGGAGTVSAGAALALVADGRLQLTDTVGRLLPGLPAAWATVTLSELLAHTSGIPDVSVALRARLAAGRTTPTWPAARAVLSQAPDRLDFRPGTSYRDASADDILLALMAERVTYRSYPRSLWNAVLRQPAGSGRAARPGGPGGFAAGWAWAARSGQPGGVVAALATGPAAPALAGYPTRCGTVTGRTERTYGYAQFAAAARRGGRLVTVSVAGSLPVSGQPARARQLRRIFTLAICSAIARRRAG